jgi:hypothetical protein
VTGNQFDHSAEDAFRENMRETNPDCDLDNE